MRQSPSVFGIKNRQNPPEGELCLETVKESAKEVRFHSQEFKNCTV